MHSRIAASLRAWPSLHAGDRRHDLPGRAVAALEGVVIDEGLLHRMQLAVAAGEAFDGGDLPAFDAHRQRQAGQRRCGR